MYSLAEKNKIIKLFGKGESVKNIRLKSNVSKSTLYRWKAQYETAKEKSKQVKAYIEQGKLAEAEKLAKEILEIDSNNLPARSQLITIYKKQGRLAEAEKLAKEIIELKPNDIPARRQLSSIHKKQGRLDEAEKLAVYEPVKVSTTSSADTISVFRQRLYDGEITVDNLSDYDTELASVPPFEQKMLLAEAYTHWNTPTVAVKLLKEASRIENISEKQSKTLKQAMQIAKSKNSKSIPKIRKQWCILNNNGEER